MQLRVLACVPAEWKAARTSHCNQRTFHCDISTVLIAHTLSQNAHLGSTGANMVRFSHVIAVSRDVSQVKNSRRLRIWLYCSKTHATAELRAQACDVCASLSRGCRWCVTMLLLASDEPPAEPVCTSCCSQNTAKSSQAGEQQNNEECTGS